MIYTVTIEEHISQAFEVDAEDMDDVKILIANIIGIQKMIVMTIMSEKLFFFYVKT